MNCFLCKGKLEKNISTFMVDLEACIVIIKNVPSQICNQCGEISYSDEVAQQLEQMANSIRDATNSELAVVNYTTKAA
jgi:YgiT-type zinc finger domain-containing protein